MLEIVSYYCCYINQDDECEGFSTVPQTPTNDTWVDFLFKFRNVILMNKIDAFPLFIKTVFPLKSIQNRKNVYSSP